MKFIAGCRAFGAAFAFVLMGFAGAYATFTLPAQTGPSLGDFNVNPYTLANAINTNTQQASQTLALGPANTQSTCANVTAPMVNLSTSSIANGSVCLPPAFAGREVMINNPSGQTLNLFGSNTPAVVGTQDTINGTAGSTAYTSTTNGTNVQCFAPALGVWACNHGS